MFRYDTSRSYRWNYEHAPDPIERDVPEWPGDWTFCGLKVDSPLGIPAGPLLNGKWCLYYASLGFDIVTYKTVRSGARGCYAPPNLVPVRVDTMTSCESPVPPSESMDGTWAVSFGMPSAAPDVWRRDVEWTRDRLPAEKLLCVSVVGTTEPGWSMQQLAEDYALCAKWALESGADVVEVNFSCPNVSTCDGQLYQDPVGSRLVAQTVRQAIGQLPLVIKIGHETDDDATRNLINAVADSTTALAMTNSIAAQVGMNSERLLFEGEKRGICGTAIHESSVQQVRRFNQIQGEGDHQLRWIGVGGIDRYAAVQNFLEAGAESCQLATSIMVDPEIGIRIREHCAREVVDANGRA
ncbi:MAG: hypothetical protein AAGI63_15405 [Planctomycetota bacterium]